jgi:hypothetical protein
MVNELRKEVDFLKVRWPLHQLAALHVALEL